MFSSQPYKGTRDFYPEDLQKRNYIFETWRRVLKANGYLEYETSLLENAEIYIQKSGQELGGSQLYNFHDKGNRFVALRPEQTPSLARLIANKFGELRLPLRWFSIPNCFRYERPQKGRLREHWQLNVDLVGLDAGPAELEILNLVGEIFQAFGANQEQVIIFYNHRQLLDKWLQKHGLISHKFLIYSVLDNWFKSSLGENKAKLDASLNTNQTNLIMELAGRQGQAWSTYLDLSQEFTELKLLSDHLSQIQPHLQYELNPCIIRGIAYYTGLVFEAFDKHPDNPRALLGGGRYDHLMDLFGQSAPAIGFGSGDVTMSEFLTGWNLWPDFTQTTPTKCGIMPFSPNDLLAIYTQIIPDLKTKNLIFEIDYDFQRSENKRWESLKKRGCQDIIKVGF
jgi:histidyl-tRNA synthetase